MSVNTNANAPLQEERDFFSAHLAEWKEKFPGKFALVKERRLVNTFDRAEDAVSLGFEQFANEPFLVRQIEESEADIFVPALAFGILRHSPAGS